MTSSDDQGAQVRRAWFQNIGAAPSDRREFSFDRICPPKEASDMRKLTSPSARDANLKCKRAVASYSAARNHPAAGSERRKFRPRRGNNGGASRRGCQLSLENQPAPVHERGSKMSADPAFAVVGSVRLDLSPDAGVMACENRRESVAHRAKSSACAQRHHTPHCGAGQSA